MSACMLVRIKLFTLIIVIIAELYIYYTCILYLTELIYTSCSLCSPSKFGNQAVVSIVLIN